MKIKKCWRSYQKNIWNFSTAMCFLTDNIYDYYNVSQGKITIPNMDDGEEFALTDVSYLGIDKARLCFGYSVKICPPPIVQVNWTQQHSKENICCMKPNLYKTEFKRFLSTCYLNVFDNVLPRYVQLSTAQI